MLTWVRSQVRQHGALAAAKLVWSVGRARVGGRLADALLPKRVACPCCGWEGRRFYDYLEAGYRSVGIECPRCFSHPRHRMLRLWVEEEFGLRAKTGVALVFAPERSLAPIWEAARGLRVVRTDIEPSRGVDLLADIHRLPFADDSADLIWCHHVLTQVADDRRAAAELHRVLRPATGELVISVAMTPGTATEEFGREREDMLGFYRVYGDDFVGRLEGAGFEVRAAGYNPPAEVCARYGFSPEVFFVCKKPGRS